MHSFCCRLQRRLTKSLAATTLLHTLSEMKADINNLVNVLHENEVTHLVEGCNTPSFEDQTEKGLKKLCNSMDTGDNGTKPT